MKRCKKIAGIIGVILFAYIYAYVENTGIKEFDMETFCMVLLLISYIVFFFKLLVRLFSR